MPGNTQMHRAKIMRAIDDALFSSGYYPLGRKTGTGINPLGRDYRIARVVRRRGKLFAVSVQHQEVSGTAEQKIAHHCMCLGATPDFYRKYLVLSGPGFSTLANNLVFNRHIPRAKTIRIVTLSKFLDRVGKRLL